MLTATKHDRALSMANDALLSLIAAGGSLAGAVATIGSGFYFVGKMRAETTANKEQAKVLTEQVDRLEGIVGQLVGSDGTVQFRMRALEDNTKAILASGNEMAEFRGEMRAQHRAFQTNLESLQREVGGIQRTLGNIAQGALHFRADRPAGE